MDEPDLSQEIIGSVVRSRKNGDSILAAEGPFFERNLKRALGVTGVHKSVVMTRVKLLVKERVLRWEVTDEFITSHGSCSTKRYPVRELVPA